MTDLLTPEERAAIRAPIESARTLPRRAFTCESFYEFERRHVLARSWAAIAFSAEIPAPGDVIPLDVLGFPVLLTRDAQGRLHAFHNVCPYDGCEVAIKAAHGKERIVTPYHGWEYGLDGRHLSAGYWDGTPAAASLKVEDLNADLRAIPCREWMSTVFVHLDGEPARFEDEIAAVLTHFESLDIERLAIGTDADGAPQIARLPIVSNWKTVYENYSPNVYHESFVHAMYRKSPDSPRVDANGNKTYQEINDPSGFLGLCYDNSIAASFYGESKLAPVRMRDGTPNRRNTIANMFPNWVITVLGDCARMALFLPDGPGSGTQVVATLFDRDVASDPDALASRERAVRLGIIAREEDNRICESVQRARRSPAVDTQFYSPFWDAMHYTLTNLVLDRIEAGERDLAA